MTQELPLSEFVYKNVMGAASRAAKKGKDHNITQEYMEDLWRQQNGRCALTGDEMTMVVNGEAKKKGSIDRIDSSKGYVVGNVQWTTQEANHMKGRLTMGQVYEVAGKIISHGLHQGKLEPQRVIETIGLSV